MAKSKAKKTKRKQTKSFILTLGIILLVGYFVITIIGLQFSIKERQDVLEQKNAVYEEQVEENEHLQSIVDSDDKSEYMEQIAREKLGFIIIFLILHISEIKRYLSFSDLFHFAQCLQGPSILSQMLRFHFFMAE